MKKTIRFMNYTCIVTASKYSNDRTAILLSLANGERVAVASVNLPDDELQPGEVFIKNWSENEGMLETLVKAGIVKDTGRRVPTGRVEACVCELLVTLDEHRA